jgi:hypothetical protein
MTRRNLVFLNLPTFESSPWFYTLPDEVDSRLRRLPGTYDRCRAALRFMSCIGADPTTLKARETDAEFMSVAYLRASLMEFVGMEDALPSDLPRGTKPLRIHETSDAMLVVLRELRNVQVHLVRSNFITTTKSAYSELDGERHEHQIVARTIPLDDLDRLRDSRNCPNAFVHADFMQAIEWLDRVQQSWGISDVVMRGIWRYASMCVDAHVPAVTA